MMTDILFFDLEVGSGGSAASGPEIRDIGAWYKGAWFHQTSIKGFARFSRPAAYICGHNILNHDLPLLKEKRMEAGFFEKHSIDTLYLSALLFPQNPRTRERGQARISPHARLSQPMEIFI